MRLADGLSFALSLMFSTACRERSYVLDSCRERSNVLDCMQKTLICSRLHAENARMFLTRAENAHMFSTACREPSYRILYFVYYNVFYSWTITSYSILGLVQLVYSIVGLSHRILNPVN